MYSLRSRNPHVPGKWIPHVTAIMNDTDTGVLGEIKGYANEKPSSKYHDALIAFMMHDKVKSLEGGGYLPENNFMLSDLDEGKMSDLINAKPSLATALELWEARGHVIDEDVRRKIAEENKLILDEGQSLDDWASKASIPIFYQSSMEDLARGLSLNEFGDLVSTIKYNQVSFHPDSHYVKLYAPDIKVAMETLFAEEDNMDAAGALKKYLESEFGSEGHDFNDMSHVIEMIMKTKFKNMIAIPTSVGMVESSNLKIKQAIDEFIGGLNKYGLEMTGSIHSGEAFLNMHPEAFLSASKKISGYEKRVVDVDDIYNHIYGKSGDLWIKEDGINKHYEYGNIDKKSFLVDFKLRLDQSMNEMKLVTFENNQKKALLANEVEKDDQSVFPEPTGRAKDRRQERSNGAYYEP